VAEPLLKNKVQCPIVAIGGVKGLGAKVGEGSLPSQLMSKRNTIADCGHFVPEECPNELVQHILALVQKVA
jgi:pimeloyl-ACP methyl ester carboxylesterase